MPDHTQSPSFFIGDDCCSECYSSDSSTEYVDREVQTDISWEDYKNACLEAVATVHESHQPETGEEVSVNDEEPLRDLDTLLLLLKKEEGCSQMSDREVQFLVEKQHIPAYKLESVLGNPQRGVAIRRRVIESYAARPGVLHEVPYLAYNYDIVLGACCENVIGYLPLPLGVAGPLLLNGRKYFVPMATTEGCLVASTNRGCRAVSLAGGLRAKVFADGMTRGPVLHFRSAMEAADAMEWLNVPQNFELIKSVFDSTSRFARLQKIHPRVAGRYLYVRFVASTGDAMGMNMLSKGTELALEELSKHVTGIEMKCLSGNFCTDKKPSSVNWIEGRGKSVVCETIVPRSIVEKVLKTSVDALVELNISKNLIGSSVAGSIGGNNAQAANIVAAIYIATGQVSPQVPLSSTNPPCVSGPGPDCGQFELSDHHGGVRRGSVRVMHDALDRDRHHWRRYRTRPTRRLSSSKSRPPLLPHHLPNPTIPIASGTKRLLGNQARLEFLRTRSSGLWHRTSGRIVSTLRTGSWSPGSVAHETQSIQYQH